MMINKSKHSKGVTCSIDKSDDLLSAEDPIVNLIIIIQLKIE
jgi:hypothetical protein